MPHRVPTSIDLDMPQVVAARLHHGELKETLQDFDDKELNSLAQKVPGFTWDARKRSFLVRHGRTYLGMRVHPGEALALLGGHAGQATELHCTISFRVACVRHQIRCWWLVWGRAANTV